MSIFTFNIQINFLNSIQFSYLHKYLHDKKLKPGSENLSKTLDELVRNNPTQDK